MKSNFRRQRPRRHVVRSAERRKKVVQRVLVRDVDRGQLQADLVLVSVKYIVVAPSGGDMVENDSTFHTDVEQELVR